MGYFDTRHPTLLSDPIDHRDHVRGLGSAEVTLVEYGDFACPSCREAHGVLKDLLPRQPAAPQDFKAPVAPNGWHMMDKEKDGISGISANKAYEFLKSKRSLLLKVPSAIIPEEYNMIINPAHPDFKKVKIIKTGLFQFDASLFK